MLCCPWDSILSHGEKGRQHVHAGGQRRDDRIYLLGGDGAGGDVCQDADIVNLHNWSLGSFSGTTWSNVRAAGICVTVIFVLVFLMSKPLFAYQLGESYALNLGVNVRLLRIGMVVFSSILSACVVAFAGPISFVGIAVPQLVKKNAGNRRTDLDDPGQLSGGQRFLPVL